MTKNIITVVSTDEHRVKYGKMRVLHIHPQVAEILEAVKTIAKINLPDAVDNKEED